MSIERILENFLVSRLTRENGLKLPLGLETILKNSSVRVCWNFLAIWNVLKVSKIYIKILLKNSCEYCE